MQWTRFLSWEIGGLPDDHILSKHRSNPSEVETMAKKEPVNLVISILGNCEDGCAQTREIERILSYLLGPTKGKKWWTATKKLLVKDPRVAVPNKKTEPYVLRDEPVKPEQEVLLDFLMRKDLPTK